MKYEEVFLKAYSNARVAKARLNDYFRPYNTQRPPQALGYRTAAEVYNRDLAQSTEQTADRRWSKQSIGKLWEDGGTLT